MSRPFTHGTETYRVSLVRHASPVRRARVEIDRAFLSGVHRAQIGFEVRAFCFE